MRIWRTLCEVAACGALMGCAATIIEKNKQGSTSKDGGGGSSGTIMVATGGTTAASGGRNASGGSQTGASGTNASGGRKAAGTGGTFAKDAGLEASPDARLPPGCPASMPPIEGMVSALSVRDARSNYLNVYLSSDAATCTDTLRFPSACQKAWRVRLSIAPAFQRPAAYPVFFGSTLFGYLDGQSPMSPFADGQAPDSGGFCSNDGRDLNGTVVITEIDATHVAGSICGDPGVEGSFRAQTCGTCQGTGMSCSQDSDCCNHWCDQGHCPP